MSLNYDLTDVKWEKKYIPYHVMFNAEPPKDLAEGEEEAQYVNPITTAVIFATMPVGLAVITEDNMYEFYARYKMTQGLMGQRPFLTIKNIQDHIGLTTNATHYKSRQTWMRELVNYMIDNTDREEKYKLKHLCTVCDNTADAPAHRPEYSDHSGYHVFAPEPAPESTVPVMDTPGVVTSAGPLPEKD